DLLDPLRQRDSIFEIAWRWGFSDPAHFSRAFKTLFGCSPRACREAQQRSVAGQAASMIAATTRRPSPARRL
ncbi:MAG TPA: helix-turn-helix domain-containing protein, partial [Dokdonella sp.]